jgi:hypothetical protein
LLCLVLLALQLDQSIANDLGMRDEILAYDVLDRLFLLGGQSLIGARGAEAADRQYPEHCCYESYPSHRIGPLRHGCRVRKLAPTADAIICRLIGKHNFRKNAFKPEFSFPGAALLLA